MATIDSFGVTMGQTCQIVRRSRTAETEAGEMSADAEDVGHDAGTRPAAHPESPPAAAPTPPSAPPAEAPSVPAPAAAPRAEALSVPAPAPPPVPPPVPGPVPPPVPAPVRAPAPRIAAPPTARPPVRPDVLPNGLPDAPPEELPDDRPDEQWARRLRRPSGTGCALTVLMIWIGIGAALIDYRLVLASRVYCGAGAETGDIFALNLEMLPRLLIGPAMAFGPYLLITFIGRGMSPLWRFAPSRALIRLIAVLAGVAAAGALIVFDFAQIGTLAGHLGDSGLCGPDNVPPWWPAWLPA
jgi:hypothetical protein